MLDQSGSNIEAEGQVLADLAISDSDNSDEEPELKKVCVEIQGEEEDPMDF